MSNEIDCGKWISESRGNLFFLNFSNLPFTPKRVFYVSSVPSGEVRGEHAHYECEQMLVCVRGRIRATLDNGKERTEHVLLEGDTLYHGKLEWAELKYYDDGEMLSFCSQEYDAEDYINNYEDFLKEVRNNEK